MKVKILQACLMLDRVCAPNDLVDLLDEEANALIRGGIAERVIEDVVPEPIERTAVKKVSRKADKWRNQP